MVVSFVKKLTVLPLRAGCSRADNRPKVGGDVVFGDVWRWEAHTSPNTTNLHFPGSWWGKNAFLLYLSTFESKPQVAIKGKGAPRSIA
jgi:hypothetical protein